MIAAPTRSEPYLRIAQLMVIALVMAACGSRAQVVERSGRFAMSAHAALDSMSDTFVAWDAQHQLDIVEGATSLEDGQKKLATYRARRQVVYAVFELAIGAVVTVAVLVPLVDAEKVSTAELIAAVAEAASAISAMRKAASALMDEVR